MTASAIDPGTPRPIGYTVRWGLATVDERAAAALWRARGDYLSAYRDACRAPPIVLSGHALVWANLLERAAAGVSLEISGPGLLPEDMGRAIARAHHELCGPAAQRPRTQADLEANETERAASMKWAAMVRGNPALLMMFAEWVPELLDDNVHPVARRVALETLARRCWPLEVSLPDYVLKVMYTKVVVPLCPPFTSLAQFIRRLGVDAKEAVVTSVVERWRREVWQRRSFRYGEIRRALRVARERVARLAADAR